MGDTVDLVLEFLRKNRFTKAEAALRGELSSCSDLNGYLQKPLPKENEEVREDFIVKEVKVGNVGTCSETKKGFVEKFDDLSVSEEPKQHRRGSLVVETRDCGVGTESDLLEELKVSFGRIKGKSEVEAKPEVNQITCFRDVKTVFAFPDVDASSSHNGILKETKKKEETSDVREVRIEQQNEAYGPYFSAKSQDCAEGKNTQSFDLPLIGEKRLPPVRIRSVDKLVNMHWEEKDDPHGSRPKLAGADNTFMMGSFLDVPIGQEINSSGGKRTFGSSWLSVSQGIAEDASDLVSGFATIGDESVDYPIEYWDSDEYSDDDDVGYLRQPIEDEAWFLAHEIDYPSDNEKGTDQRSAPDQQDLVPTRDEDDDQSFAEESFFREEDIEQLASSKGLMGPGMREVYGKTDENDLIAQYDRELVDVELEENLVHAQPVWGGFVAQNGEQVTLGNGNVQNEWPQPNDFSKEDDRHGSVRSIGVGINSDAADIGSEVHGGSSGADIEYFHDHNVAISGTVHSQNDKNHLSRSNGDNRKGTKQEPHSYPSCSDNGNFPRASHVHGGFSFPPPSSGDMLEAASGKSLWSSKGNIFVSEDADVSVNGMTEDMLTSWRKESTDSSPGRSSQNEKTSDVIRSRNSTASLNYPHDETEDINKLRDHKVDVEEDAMTILENEEAAALQEQVRQIKAQEEEFETFNLKIVHRKNRTGFEEDKSFHVVLNSVIAGRYHVTEYLGSAAFSNAIQAHDLHTGMDVCMKIIKNNKDFFDQSLDEIKLLKFVNKHDPGDKYHILRLYDYFYYREHLLIVCELLKANLYEFQKFNRESGGEVYFTMPRLQSIAIQCLEALQFLHDLGLIHSDLKPENILVKSYSRCEVKVIDLGSSCFETDHLCSYVQSRSYRAPEVILGIPYGKKIDIWSLGCILAELCTGNVLFQNDSPATLVARVIGIVGPIEQVLLAKGRDTYKYFTKNHMLYERNQETNRLEYLIPKKSSLRHRLPMADQGFIEFVAHLLEINPKKRPSASEALKHPWLSYPYEPISS
ncbi:uncharacterized protein [Typha angustifolia]|uniref:uncharacterized protein isoform X1 n=1 Tax=Typha angustifolia TaxID=59011 RepID=UPI003C2E0886